MPVTAEIAYAARTDFRQRYYANDHSRDTVVLDPHPMVIADGREAAPSLDAEGFMLARHESAVNDFRDGAEVAASHSEEIAALIKVHTGADMVSITGPGILRFSEASGLAGTSDNSHPARFVHVDTTGETAAGFARQATPEGKTVARYAHYNVWRAFSGAPQDVGLALCDHRSLASGDLMVADAIFDPPGGAPEWSFESWLLAYNPAHRWTAFPNLTRDDVLIFKTSDSLHANPAPHVAYNNPEAPADAPPRASIEMRALAFWFA